MDFLKRLKEAGIIDFDEAHPEGTAIPGKQLAVPPATMPAVDRKPHYTVEAAPSVGTNGTGGAVDEVTLNKLMAEVNSSAPDNYARFQAMLVTMSALPSMTLQAAYQAAAAAVGITKPQINAAIDQLQQRLTKEEADYKDVIAQAMKERVGAKQDDIAKLGQDNDTDSGAIQELQSAIANRSAQVDQLNQDIHDTTAKINGGAATFQVTAAQVRAKLEQTRQQAAQHIA